MTTVELGYGSGSDDHGEAIRTPDFVGDSVLMRYVLKLQEVASHSGLGTQT